MERKSAIIVQQQFFIIRGQYIKGKDKRKIKANKYCSLLYCTVIGKTKGGSTRD